MSNKHFCFLSVFFILGVYYSRQAFSTDQVERLYRSSTHFYLLSTDQERPGKIILSDEQWMEKLTDGEYNVCRKRGTEKAGSGELLKNKDKGVYTCACCGAELFHSSTKFDSGTGWPSFYDVLKDKDVSNLPAVETHTDMSHGMTRSEVRCGKCEAHLGHVFDDGPPPTGLRYCINSVCLHFKPDVLDNKETRNEL